MKTVVVKISAREAAINN